MTIYQEGYEYYVSKCEQFGLEPINFTNFIEHLSQEQLDRFNEHARIMKEQVK
ncbi:MULTISPECIES: hypothetical protein [Ureibacillus]|jgi:hypothetical protein|uniref:Uncharacterized protein n=1 Tax=Ureibacillus thermosphaericus TaxID=51173 RepID=A0A840PMA7_URETH|nr:hypothetical protein [Ureibacillus thermosphaericus]MBB5149545.1 hypothetical protein [Ureibacillus thermosphaericus]NKZ32409.1 transcriptional regulator [Ureibacillus thermosphaericus]